MHCIDDVICDECGEVRIKTPSGAVCPNGHGRVKPGVTTIELQEGRLRKWAMQFPQGTTISPRIFEVDGEEYIATFVRHTDSFNPVYKLSMSDVPRNGTRFIRDESGRPRCVKKRKASALIANK